MWSPDGSQLAFMSDRRSTGRLLSRRHATGAGDEEVLLARAPSPLQHVARRMASTDGLVYATVRPGTTLICGGLPPSGDRTPVPLLQNAIRGQILSAFRRRRWMAYASSESGRFEVYAAAFPSGQGKWPISVAGGTEPAWRRDGKELFYLAPDRHLMAVPIKTGASVQARAPGAPLPGGRVILHRFTLYSKSICRHR